MSQIEPLRVEITLEIAPDAGPPCGEIRTDGTRQPFTGWMGLILGLHTAINDARESEHPPPCPA